jgi:hypothetical protein
MQLGIKSKRNIEKMITVTILLIFWKPIIELEKIATCKDYFKATKNEIEKRY